MKCLLHQRLNYTRGVVKKVLLRASAEKILAAGDFENMYQILRDIRVKLKKPKSFLFKSRV